jgi:hypothetical protein
VDDAPAHPLLDDAFANPAVDGALKARDVLAFCDAVEGLQLLYDPKQMVYQRVARAELNALPEAERAEICLDLRISRAGRQLRKKSCRAVLERVWKTP